MIYSTAKIDTKDMQLFKRVSKDTEITRVDMDFSDEGIDLQGSVKVKEDSAVARAIFERDIRQNYRHLFPLPDPEPMEEELEELFEPSPIKREVK